MKFHLSGQRGAADEERDWELVAMDDDGRELLLDGSFLISVGSTKEESWSESLEWMLVTSVLQSLTKSQANPQNELTPGSYSTSLHQTVYGYDLHR
jgi:hypothetical protein